ncbi:MAG: phenylacetate--CoA ligase [Spirochaetota bacterium]
MKYWDERFETMSADEMKKFQSEQLIKTINRTYNKVPFYKKFYDKMGVNPVKIKSIDELPKLPLTGKEDVRNNYPFGLCAVPFSEVVRIHASSGTTGKPITGLYTAGDMEQWTECMARNLWAAGIRPEDICQNSYQMGLFTGGLGFHQGATKLGCAVIPISSGRTERQLMVMQDFGVTVLFSTPSYALTLAERAEDMGIKIDTLKLRIGVFGAEPWRVEIRKEIEAKMKIKALDCYGLIEFAGPGVAFECEEQNGLHINEDHFIAEIINPDTGETLPPGSKGELILTSIRREAMPMIRYRTRDITTLHREKCSCGRTLLKMDKILGRSDDMLIINGINVFPSTIESLLMELCAATPQYVIFVRKKGYMDQLCLDIEGKKEIFETGPQKIAEVERAIESKIFDIVGIRANIRLVPPKTLPRSEGKGKRVFDERRM